ncbi:MAG: acyloxyacyl hydrolase [Alphaproteobacteria bacterium]|nr:acyloxyacyl hydrolase [Alphaproteobacteria bacterium]
MPAQPAAQPRTPPAVSAVPRIAHPVDSQPLNLQATSQVPLWSPDAYRRPYDQYLGGWSAPPPQLDSIYVPPASTAPLPQVQVAVAPVPPAPPAAAPQAEQPRAQLAQSSVAPPAPEPRLRYGEGSVLGVSELRFGVLAHNKGAISDHTEHGVQVNIEARFRSPDFMRIILEPRPTLGISANTAGDTSFAYAGLTWGGFVWGGLFVEGFFGMAVHDGELNSRDPAPHERRQMGSRAVFREAIEVGYRFLENHSISFMLDHYSNAGWLAERNQGNDDLGLRYGYKF